uniref:Uncharacterized protein n=1 Tax=Aegilops tauschii subsp. strangulata TaxID=200361 RepID=A0A452XVH9_AEGTS
MPVGWIQTTSEGCPINVSRAIATSLLTSTQGGGVCTVNDFDGCPRPWPTAPQEAIFISCISRAGGISWLMSWNVNKVHALASFDAVQPCPHTAATLC